MLGGFGGPGGPGRTLNQATLKPKNTGQTLARLMTYFAPWWPMLLFALVAVVVATWAQVTTPELTGQLVDCYLTPSAASTLGNFPGVSNLAGSSNSSCWLAQGAKVSSATDGLIQKVFSLADLPVPRRMAAISTALAASPASSGSC